MYLLMHQPGGGSLHRANILFPRELWRALVIAAAEDETTATAIVLDCVRRHLNERARRRERRKEGR
jgi:hypothetical protein